MTSSPGGRAQRVRGGALDWNEERDSWPLADTSRFVEAAGHRWHVQQAGTGPAVLLIHGTGASSHSWRALSGLLSDRFTVVAPDLPGHAFTGRASGRRLSLPAMAAALAELVAQMKIRPEVVVGHSAGAAVGIRCCLDGTLAPSAVVSVNGALLPFRGPAGFLFPPLAKLLFLNPLAPRIFARGAADRERVQRLIRDTGSELDAEGIDLYARLFASRAHVSATLGMMAHWQLNPLVRDLPGLRIPLLLLTGENDRAVAPADAERVAGLVPGARVARLAGAGHLAHEERPAETADLICRFVDAGPSVAVDRAPGRW